MTYMIVLVIQKQVDALHEFPWKVRQRIARPGNLGSSYHYFSRPR